MKECGRKKVGFKRQGTMMKGKWEAPAGSDHGGLISGGRRAAVISAGASNGGQRPGSNSERPPTLNRNKQE